jgi:hypothetical protein
MVRCHGASVVVSIVLRAVAAHGWTTAKIGAPFTVRICGNQGVRRLSRSFTQLCVTLTSALEERSRSDSLPSIPWIDLHNYVNTKCGDEFDNALNMSAPETIVKMPLYPVPAVHLPDGTNVNCTFWNVEQRNIQMALDLEHDMLSHTAFNNGTESAVSNGGLFCVVLQARDTGRVVPIGTVVRVLQMDKELKYDAPIEPNLRRGTSSAANFRRIVVTCVPLAQVDILEIENPSAATREYRYRHPNEYLVATVRYRSETDSCHDLPTRSNGEPIAQEALCCQIQESYNRVRSLYLDSSVATQNWPPKMVSQMKSLSLASLPPLVEANSLLSTTEFWSMAQSWQTLCETVRAVHEMTLVAHRNEYMVSAAIRKGGPLQLPVHIEDLPKEDRFYVQGLENSAQHQWLDLKLDPCIDFYVLLSMQNHSDRLRFFSQMVERECRRLEILVHAAEDRDEKLQRYGNSDDYFSDVQSNDMADLAPLRKGAWFNDECW